MSEPVSVEAVRQRAEHAWEWAEEVPVPSPVRMHFERDMPALLDELESLRAEVERTRPLRDAAVAWVGAKRVVDALDATLTDYLDYEAAEDALEQAILAALDGQPEGSPT